MGSWGIHDTSTILERHKQKEPSPEQMTPKAFEITSDLCSIWRMKILELYLSETIQIGHPK